MTIGRRYFAAAGITGVGLANNDGVADHLHPAHVGELMVLAVYGLIALLSVSNFASDHRDRLRGMIGWLDGYLPTASDAHHAPGWRFMARGIRQILDRLINGETVYSQEVLNAVDTITEVGAWLATNGVDDPNAARRREWIATLTEVAGTLPANSMCPRTPVGERLRDRRNAHGLKQKDVAAFCEVSEMTVSRWERSERPPGRLHRKKLAELLGGSPADYEE